MSQLICKINYYTNHSKNVGGMLEYIGTREGVEKLNQVSDMLTYIAERPMVESWTQKFGTHGLFSKTDEPIHLYAQKKKIDEYQGNIYCAIVSLKRPDADRLCYNSASAWIPTIRAQMVNVAHQMKLREDDLEWYAAYHDHPEHPHCHILFYSKSQKGWLSKKGIENIRQGFVKEVLAQDLIQLYSKKTDLRNDLKKYTKSLMSEIFQRDSFSNPRLEQLLYSLAMELKNVQGKKVYGYLKPELKAKVNEIFSLLAQDEKIAELYKGWCEVQAEIIKSYKLDFDALPSLTDQKEFHSIRNQIIQAAVNLGPISQSPTENRSAVSQPDIASSVVSLLKNLNKMISDSYRSKHKKAFGVDRKLKSQIIEKKEALGQHHTGEDESEDGYNMSL